MNNQTITPSQGSLGFFFPQPEPLKTASKETLSGIKFRGQRTDLEVYHLAYGTKKLRACTYRRMKKRQDRINQKKAKMLIVKSPEEKMLKANKQAWLRSVEETIVKQNLQATSTIVPRLKKGKGESKRRRKHKRAIKAKIEGNQTNTTLPTNAPILGATATKIKPDLSNQNFPSLLDTEMKD